MHAKAAAVTVGLLSIILGCATGPTKEESWALAKSEMTSSLTDRVAFEAGCAKEEVRVTYIDNGTIGVEACGQRLVFVVIPNGVQPQAACGDPIAPGIIGKPHTWYSKYCKAVLNSTSNPVASGDDAPEPAP